MKKSRVIIFVATLGIPFFALAQQYGTRPDGFGNRVPLGPPSQQRPVLQPYYPLVTPSPSPAPTSIGAPYQAPTQGPRQAIAPSGKPVLNMSVDSNGKILRNLCPYCDDLVDAFGEETLKAYFTLVNATPRPAIQGGVIGSDQVAAFLRQRMAEEKANPIKPPVIARPELITFKPIYDEKGVVIGYGLVRADGSVDFGGFTVSFYKKIENGKIADSRFVEIDKQYKENKNVQYPFTLGVGGKPDILGFPATGPKKVPNPKDVPAVDDDPMFDPPPKKAPATMTQKEAGDKIESLRKLLEQIQKDDAEKAKAGATSGSR